MISNQQEMQLQSCDVQSLKNEALRYAPPLTNASVFDDEQVKLSLDGLASPSLEFLVNKMFCL